METNPQTVKDHVGQTVELGKPHEPLPNEKRHGQQPAEKIDMNPGEPARPYVGGEEPKQR